MLSFLFLNNFQAEEFLKDKVEEMKRDQKESIRRLTDEHDLSMSSNNFSQTGTSRADIFL